MRLNKTIVGKQYGYRSSALRAIRNYQIRFFPILRRGVKFLVNKIDEGCYEIIAMR